MAAINAIDLTSLLFQEGSAPSTPASTKWRLYFKTDGLYVIDDAGTEYGPLGESGSASSVTTVYRATDQNVSGSGTITDISFSNEVVDTDGLWTVGSPTVFTIPSALNGRRVVVSGATTWTASSGGNYRALYIDYNAGTRVANSLVDNAYAGLGVAQNAITQPITVATSDTFKLQIRANTTGIGAIGGQHVTWMSLYTVD